MFSLEQRYILQHYKISLECKTWIIVYTALTDRSIRKELSSIVDVDKWILKISSKTCDNDTSSIWSFIREWYAPTCVDYTQQKRKFLLLLQWFIGKTIHENHYVKYTKAMGLGLYATNDITIDELSNCFAGFLEFIVETMFDILNIFGYNSMYVFDDHSTTEKKIVHSLWSTEFGECTISSKRRKYYKTTIQVDDFDASEERVYKNTIKTEWDDRRLPVWPEAKSKDEKKLVPRVSISWCGRKEDFTNSTRIVKKDNQILIFISGKKKSFLQVDRL